MEFGPDEFRFAQGEVFAWSGNEGYSFGPHLHFEIVINGTAVNPSTYLGKSPFYKLLLINSE